jgi:UDP-N-acetylmuramoylalanine--D-glutamate ligase
MEDYAKAKILIGKLLKGSNKLLVFEEVHREFFPIFGDMEVDLYGYSSNSLYWTDLEILYRKTDRLCVVPEALKGRKSHDLENFMAAFALCTSFSIPPEKIVSGWSTFNKPHHRIEFLGEQAGVAYFDDSKGTNIDAVIRAVETMTRPTILIAGGVHKGASYVPWVKSFSGKVKKIFALGESAPLIKQELEDLISVVCCSSMKEAVELSAGDAVLLSPGCSSFDMFRDYAHRGDEFAKCVKELGNAIEAKI